MARIEGRAAPEGTARFADRYPEAREAGHFRPGPDGLLLPSLGIGTYLGEADQALDAAYREAVRTAFNSGIHLADTASNYRHMRSERAVGAALAEAVEAGEIQRDEVVLSTKGGFIAFDGSPPADPQAWFEEVFVETGRLEREDFVGGVHAMNPDYLDFYLDRSLENLGVATVDIYLLHNTEIQLQHIERDTYLQRLHTAFSWCEEQARAGRIASYGMATWETFRVARDNPVYMGLDRVLELAEEAGGADHRFRAVQLPLSLGLPEALTVPNQTAPDGEEVPVLEAARRRDLTVLTSASALQGNCPDPLPPHLEERIPAPEDAVPKALQFTRSAPGVTTALVGMKQRDHVEANAALRTLPPMSGEDFRRAFLSEEGTP